MMILNKFKVVAWNIGFIEKSIENLLSGENYHISWMRHNYNDRFFADPFVLSCNEDTITILAEEYNFVEAKGKIVKLAVELKTKKLLKRELLIETEFHMSYPFTYNNTIVAEQSASGKWIQYDLSGKKLKELSRIGFIDGTIFNDGSSEWLFATRVVTGKEDANKKLYRYKMENGEPSMDTELLIKDDKSCSRPGGCFFKVDNDFYRVAQTSTNYVYGESISICKIIECSEKKYEEQVIVNITSRNEKRFNKGLHTLNFVNNLIVVDGFEMQFHPIQKVKNKIVQKRKRKGKL